MTVVGIVIPHDEFQDHLDAKDREIESKEEIIRLQADEIARLNSALTESHLCLKDAVSIGSAYVGLQRAFPGGYTPG